MGIPGQVPRQSVKFDEEVGAGSVESQVGGAFTVLLRSERGHSPRVPGLREQAGGAIPEHGLASVRMANAMFNDRADSVRRRVLSPLGFKLFLWKELPLAAVAGLRLRSLDEGGCTVMLPGGWRTQNPFKSTYFAAQSMAAEMSTGAPAMVLVRGSEGKISMLVTEIRARFTKKIAGPSQFTFRDLGDMAATIERAAQTGEPATFVATSVGRNEAGEVASEFEVTWSFKRRD